MQFNIGDLVSLLQLRPEHPAMELALGLTLGLIIEATGSYLMIQWHDNLAPEWRHYKDLKLVQSAI